MLARNYISRRLRGAGVVDVILGVTRVFHYPAKRNACGLMAVIGLMK